MQSARISDALYDLASREAKLMNRSVAQQLEHWARLGVALEASGATADDLKSAAIAFQHAATAVEVEAGKRDSRSLHVIPGERIRRATIQHAADAFQTGRGKW